MIALLEQRIESGQIFGLMVATIVGVVDRALANATRFMQDALKHSPQIKCGGYFAADMI